MLREKFSGGIIGSALGDGIGELAFSGKQNKTPNLFLSLLQKQTDFIYTDDTAMALGIIESLLANQGKIIESHLGDTFAANYDREPWRGYAFGPPKIFSTVKKTGKKYSEVASSLYQGGSFGNGAPMRIAPLGVFFYDASEEELYEQAMLSSIITHSHPIGIDGAAILAFADAMAMKLDPKENFPMENFLERLINFSRTQEMREKLQIVKTSLQEKWTPFQTAKNLILSVATHESVPFAIYSFLRNPKSYQECLFCSILNGGDRDTMGAMAGGISGAYLGISAISSEWVAKLEKRIYFENLTEQLYQLKMQLANISS